MNKSFENFYNEISNNKELNNIWKKTNERAKKKNKVASITSTIIIIIIDIFVIKYFKTMIPTFNLKSPLMFYPIEFVIILIIDLLVYTLMHMSLFIENAPEYSKKYKEIVLNNLFKNVFDTVNYNPGQSMPEDTYAEGDFETYDYYSSEDYIETSIDNKYKMIMAEISTQIEKEVEGEDGEKNTEIEILFNGLFAKIELEKSINNEIRISPNCYDLKNHIKMDSQEFEKYFSVSTTNQIVGMQLLTHDFMELLVDIVKKYQNTIIDIYIKNNIIYIRLHTGWLFEVDFNSKEVIDKDTLKEDYDVLEFIKVLAQKIIEKIEETPL